MRFKRWTLFAVVMIITSVLAACSNQVPQQGAKKGDGLKIVTSFYPIYAMVKEVSGNLNDVRMIQSGAGIHDFEPSVSDVSAIYEADVFVYHSHTLESWAGKLDPNLQHSDVKVLEASTGMSLERVPGLEDVEVSEGIDEATLYDPHTWVDPVLVAEEVRIIANQLSEVDPKNEKVYQANAEKMAKEAEALAVKFKDIFAKTTAKTFVTQHTAFSYTAKRFGLEQLGIANVSDQEPSPKRLAEIKEFIDSYDVKTIFVERGASDKMAQTLVNSTGVDVKVLEPLESDPQNNLTYLENLEANLNVLAESLK